MIRKIIKAITAPKITIYLKSGNIIRTKIYPLSSYDAYSIQVLGEYGYGDIIPLENREALVCRKWWQKWG